MNENIKSDNSIRAFIAIDLVPQANLLLEAATSSWKNTAAGETVTWIPVENYHLTLVFLGEILASSLLNLSLTLKQLAQNFSPFTLSLTGLDYFPDNNHPKVLAAQVEPHATLMELQAQIVQALHIKLKPQIFLPHITVGRFKHDQVKANVFSSIPLNIVSHTSAFYLYQSHLSSEPVKYEKLGEFRLG